MKKNARWISLLMTASVATGLVGCSDDQIAAGLGAIAIGAGIIAIGEAMDHSNGGGHSVCEGGYREVCHDFQDYWGRWRRECRSEYDSCARRRWVSHSSIQTLQSSEKAPLNEVTWGETFQIGFDGSSKFLSALEKAKNKDLTAILNLGLSRDDVQALSKLSMPSEAGIDALAKSLEQDVSATREMVKRLIDIAAEEQRKASLKQISGA